MVLLFIVEMRKARERERERERERGEKERRSHTIPFSFHSLSSVERRNEVRVLILRQISMELKL